MSAATVHRTAASPLLVDRVVLGVGLALVSWSRRRTARRARLDVRPAGEPLTAAERADRLPDPYSSRRASLDTLPPRRNF
ncbi:hypothetical protein [Frondihabitans sp. VKM Ac-2883]|uniref:hypothetical protein n=1 Tax=Frondihabitans sp. VKM Ac-2883 TaxID=2783823 RepID=UPI00188CC254|nr:hypothetical protein [Frondihabitans sp. VKM Ac-2883]MBF4576714.1 hypothetical protein [Frondihabitans sp. VKM Ac-2883]